MHGRPFQPPLRWVPDPKNKDDEQWGYTHFLQTSYKFHLESALARIQHSKRRWRGPAQIPEDEITPITGNSTAGILKRYANAATGGAAFPEHLTAAEEKGIGSKIRDVYGGNDTIQNQADIEAYNTKEIASGVTHGQVFDAAEVGVSVLGVAAGGLSLSRAAGLGEKAATGSSLPLFKNASLSDVEARKFYLEGERQIGNLNGYLKQQLLSAQDRALELIDTRNSLRTKTRDLMADQERANLLKFTDPNLTAEQLVEKAQAKGLAGDEVWEYLSESSSRSRASVNQSLGVKP